MRPQLKTLIILVLVFGILLTACTNPSPTPGLDTATPTSAATPVPTAEPERLVYVSTLPTDADLNVPLLTQFAAEDGLQFVQVASLGAPPLSTARIVVLSEAPDDLPAMLDANPEIQFILLAGTDLTGKPNLSVVSAKAEDVYFMAGYLTTLIAYDWRSAGLVTGDTPLGDEAANAFFNGGKYICGKCNPSYPPLVNLPQVTSLPKSATSTEWLTAANAMLSMGVNAFFLDPAAATPEVVAQISASQITLIGTTPPPAGAEALWGATITSDNSVALKEVLAKAFIGEGGQEITVPITLTQVNETLVSPARQDLFNQTAELLSTGKLAPLNIP